MSLPGSRRARPECRQPSRTQRSHTPRASNSPALNRPEPLKRPPTTTAVIWLIGMLTLLTGVILRIAGNKPLGGAILLLGAVILILGRLGNLRGR